MANNNKNKILNVPNLRFPEFTGEWKKCTLGEIGLGFDYGMNAAAKPYDGVHKYIRITDIEESSSCYINKDIVSPDCDLQDSYIVKPNDILFTRTGASTGKTYLYDKNDGILYFAGFLIRVNIPHENSYFIFSQLHTQRYRKWVTIMSARSGQPGINSQEYSTYEVSNTCIQEQNKIAKLLLAINTRIATQNKIIDKLESLIKGIGNTLLNDSNIDGRLVKLADICHISTGKLDANAMVKEGEYPFFTCAEKPFRINDYAFDTEALLVSGNGANLGYINYYKGQFNAYQRTYVLDEFTENIQFVRIALKVFLPKRIAIEKSTSNTPYIVLSTLSEMRLFIPNEIIQKDVVKLTINLETKLSLQESLLVHYKKTKHYLLQQMFI
jgi:type I restriction enzyme S subunit